MYRLSQATVLAAFFAAAAAATGSVVSQAASVHWAAVSKRDSSVGDCCKDYPN